MVHCCASRRTPAGVVGARHARPVGRRAEVDAGATITIQDSFETLGSGVEGGARGAADFVGRP
jgi:hypothetical protein